MPAACRALTIATNSAISAPGTLAYPGVRGEEAQRGVSPVVGDPAREQRRLVRDRGHRQQLDGRRADAPQVPGDGGVGHPEVGAAVLGRHLGMQHRPSAHVRLDDHRLRPRHVRPRFGEGHVGRGDHRERHVAERIHGAIDADHRVTHPAAGRLQVGDAPGDLPGVGVDEDLGRVGADARPRLVAPVYAIPVALTGVDIGNVPMPDPECLLGQRDAPLDELAVVVVDEADLDGVSAVGGDREADPSVFDMGTQREDTARSTG